MSFRLKYSLLSDGASDDVLINVIDWTIQASGFEGVVQPQFVDFCVSRNRPTGLRSRISAALDLYPCDILFIHRDAEGQEPDLRFDEIRIAVPPSVDYVPIIPIRMTEAWLLFDVNAICTAADNPEYAPKLNLPRLKKMESIADPKRVLYDSMIEASACSGRRLELFKRNYSARYRRVAQLIDDYSPLRALPAFQQFEQDCLNAMIKLNLLP